jgi:hypothetical protein
MVHRNKEMQLIENHREEIRRAGMEVTVFVSLTISWGRLEGVSLGRRSLDAKSGSARRPHSFGISRPELRERESLTTKGGKMCLRKDFLTNTSVKLACSIAHEK